MLEQERIKDEKTMQLKLNINKTVEQNAAIYFELAKKAKRKLEGANKAIAENKKKLELLVKEQQKKEIDSTEQNSFLPKAKKSWYEKFRWFYSTEGRDGPPSCKKG